MLALQPASALATRAPSDRIGEAALSSGVVTTSAAPDIDAAAGLLMLPDGRTLWARRAEDRRAMASITKLMTALVVLEETGLDDTATVSKAAAGVDWALGLKAGEEVKVRTLLEYLLVVSSNDAAITLAEHTSGSVPAFVTRMNAKATRLGLDGTRFVNPHGLDAAGHYSSPRDVAALLQTAMESEEVSRILELRSVRLPSHPGRSAKTVKATDELLGRYDGLLGGKTGFTEDAKYSFVGCAEREGVELVAVIMGARSNSARFTQTRALLDWGFAHVYLHRLGAEDGTLERIAIAENPQVRVPVRAAETSAVPVFDLAGEVTQEVEVGERVKLPVFEGLPLGTVEVRQAGRTLLSAQAVAASSLASAEETVGRVPVSDYLDRSVIVRAGTTTDEVRAFDVDEPVHRRIDVDERVSAPVEKGQLLGHISYVQGGELVVRVPIVAGEAVEKPGLFEALGISFTRGWRGLMGGRRMATLELVG